MLEKPQTRQKMGCAPTRTAFVSEPFKARPRHTAGFVGAAIQVHPLEARGEWW